jgi:amino-acid N-acetyltransferase
MDGTTLQLRRADEEALGYIESLLDASELPTADVRSSVGRFYVAHDGDNRVGAGGLEIYGTDGLLRSVVVEQSVRGEGVGGTLLEALEAKARAAGVETLYLLTTTAAEFFVARGYEETERSAPPAEIRGASEFEDLCPTAATCLRKAL